MKMRAAASVLLAGSVLLSLTACEFITPQQTTRSYSPSDGINANAGSVEVRDAFLVTLNGTDASMIVTFINTASSMRTVSMQYRSDAGTTTKRVVVPANGLVSSRPGSEVDVTFRGIKAKLGSLFPVYFSSGSGTPAQLGIPVLDNSLPGYQTLAPSPAPIPTSTSDTGDQNTPAPTPTITDNVEPSNGTTPTPAAG